MAEENKNTDDVKPKAGAKRSHFEEAVARGVEKFIDIHLRNSPFSRDTTAWNHFHEGKPVLIGSIVKELEG